MSMYDGTETKMRRRRDAITSHLTPTDLRTTERSTVDMERAVENFRRRSAKRGSMMGESQVRRRAEEIRRKLFRVALMFGIGIAIVPTEASARQPIACGTTYTVARGDTLFKIAERAFGNGWLYKQIFKANRDVLPNSASVEIGNELLIPCLDGAGQAAQAVREDAVAQEPQEPPAEPGKPEATPVAATMEPARTTPGLLIQATNLIAMIASPMQSIAGPAYPTATLASIASDGLGATELAISEPPRDIPRIRLLTGSGFASFADENLPQGGMITDLVSRALKAVAPGQKSRVTFVNDRAAHLNYLLPDGTFDVSFPWFKPDCSKSERLNAEMQRGGSDAAWFGSTRATWLLEKT